ncbi:SDR family NAD(P)-dependent oxidoreductase [Paraburkholderia humisilvae]|uniref:Glucose 1-dehydrogenase 1 n=1 Tax=Paraburkholderia humisilvae TaxID=627669 RepID=A0A6J5EGI6_9BURK|nr:Glucose 1-dehydrogenase 1 [Paraburkholderia humisilvae]
MDLKLKGKRALVTGSTAGLGEAIACLLASEGATVIVHGRDQGRATAVAEAIIAAGGAADIAPGDLATGAGADTVAAKARQGGAIDILVNHAGDYHHLRWTTASASSWIKTYQANVLSAVRMIKRFVPAMRERGWGRVIQIGAGSPVRPGPIYPDSCAAVAARHNVAVSLALDLKNTGVTSNIVAPGAILVPGSKELLEEVAPQYGRGDARDEIEVGCARDMVPNDVGRLGRPEEVAAAVAYLSSVHADYVTGATIWVDGGPARSAF